MSPRFSASELFLRAQSDERLAALAAEGNTRAFAALVERHRQPLLAHARRLVGAERGEDVVQQALVRAWSSLERGAEVRHPRAWLHRILHNAGLSEIERHGQEAVTLPEDLADPRSAAMVAEQRLEVGEMLRGLATLPERQRLALLGTEIEGRSRRQLAVELGLSEGAVRQLVHRARAGMRASVAALAPPAILARSLRASGWWRGGGANALHPATETAAASGFLVGGAVKVGTVLLAIGALGGGLLVHDEHGRGPGGRASHPPLAALHTTRHAIRASSSEVLLLQPAGLTEAALQPALSHIPGSPVTRAQRAATPRVVRRGAATVSPSRRERSGAGSPGGGGPGRSGDGGATDSGRSQETQTERSGSGRETSHSGGENSGSGDGTSSSGGGTSGSAGGTSGSAGGTSGSGGETAIPARTSSPTDALPTGSEHSGTSGSGPGSGSGSGSGDGGSAATAPGASAHHDT